MMESPVWRLVFKMFYFAHAQAFPPLFPVSFKIISILAHLLVVYSFAAQIFASEMRVQTRCCLSLSPPHWLVSEWEPQLPSGLTAGWLSFCRMLKRCFIPRCFQMQRSWSFQFLCACALQGFKNLFSPKTPFCSWGAFSRLLGHHLGVFPSCPRGVAFVGCQGRSLLSLAQQPSNGCSCSQGS